MTLLLLAVIYIAFIGLGIPDSLIGSAWPAIYTEWGLQAEKISLVTVTISGCTVLSSLLAARLLKRFGTLKVTLVSTMATALALLGFSFSGRFFFLVLLSVPLGLGAGAIDTGLNNYIALHYSARHMNLLHAFYGIGVSFSPYVMSLAIARGGWRGGYRYAALAQLLICGILALSVPLWKKGFSAEKFDQAENATLLSYKEMLKSRSIRLLWMVMFATNVIEYACGAWGATFLAEGRGASAEQAARFITLFYIGMALGRLASGLAAGNWKNKTIVIIGVATVLCSVALMLLPLPLFFTCVAFFLVGFGNGPIYPTLLQSVPGLFGEEASQSIIGGAIAAAYTGVMLTPPLFGLIHTLCGISAYPSFIAAAFFVMIAGLALLEKGRRGA